MKEAIKYSFVLSTICLIAGLLLGAVYAVTQPLIQAQASREERAALGRVLPGAARIKETEKQGTVFYSAMDERGELLGYIFICEAKGYSGTIKAAVSVKPAGEIIAIEVLAQNETPGIGSQISEEGFLGQFKGKTKQDRIDGITGATISSSALIKSVQETLEKIFQ